MKIKKVCLHCQQEYEEYKSPQPTVDIIIEIQNSGIVLIKRKNPPYGWALPGGFVDYGESLEDAAVREAKEETSLDVKLIKQLHTYSDPLRDPRFHTISTVFIAEAVGYPIGKDDASDARIFTASTVPETLAFDHKHILADYLKLNRVLK